MREQTLAVQRMQDYIEQNKTMEITLSDLAKVSLFSPWYSYRLFRDYLGLTPTEYIRKLRLSQAALRLRDGEDKVIDIAFDLGFGSVDTFTRAFFREYGCNPSDYRKNPSPVPLFIPYGVKYRELRKEYFDMSNVQTVFVQVVHKPERLCIIKRGVRAEDYFPYCEEVSCDVWGILMSMRSLCGEPVCLWLPEKAPRSNVCSAQNRQIAEPCVCLEKTQRRNAAHFFSASACSFRRATIRKKSRFPNFVRKPQAFTAALPIGAICVSSSVLGIRQTHRSKVCRAENASGFLSCWR